MGTRGSPGERGSSPSPRSPPIRSSISNRWAGPRCTRPGRARHRRHVPHRRAGPVRRAARVDRGAALPRLLPRVPRLVQDLERGDGRRQYLHGLARRPDDLAHGRPRGHLHAVAARRGAADRPRRRLRDRRPCQRAAAGGIAAEHPAPRPRAREARRLPPRHAHPSRAIGRPAHRDRDSKGRRSPLTVTAATVRPVQLRFARAPSADELRHAARRARSGRRLPRRRARLAGRTAAISRTTMPSRFAPSWQERPDERTPSTASGSPPNPSPASACARSCASSASSASRRDATRATAARARSGSTARPCTAASFPRFGRPAARSRPSKGSAGRRAAPHAAGVPRRPGVPVRLLHGRHDHDGGLASTTRRGRICRACSRATCAGAPDTTRSTTPSTASCPPRRTSPAAPAARACNNPFGASIVTGRARYTLDVAMDERAAPESPALAARARAHPPDRPREGAGHARRRRRLHLGGRPAPALQHGDARGSPRRSGRHVRPRQHRPLRGPARGRRRRRDRGRGGSGVPGARGRVRGRCPPSSTPSRPWRRERRSSTRRAARPRQHLCRHPRRGRQRRRGLPGRGRRARDDLLDVPRPARTSGDARHRGLEGQGRPAPRPHQLAGAVHHQAEALLPVRALPAQRARLHRARRRRVRRQAGDALRGSVRPGHAQDGPAGAVGVHARGAVHRRDARATR